MSEEPSKKFQGGVKRKFMPAKHSLEYKEMLTVTEEFKKRYLGLQEFKQSLQNIMDAEFHETKELAETLLNQYGNTWQDLAHLCGTAEGTVHKTLASKENRRLRLSSGGFPHSVNPARKTAEEMEDEVAFPNLAQRFFDEEQE